MSIKCYNKIIGVVDIKKGDLIILIIIVLAIILYFLFNYNIQGDSVIIEVDNKFYKEIVLNNSVEKELVINFNNNKYIKLCYNKDGIYVKETSCPDKICQKTGKINKSNQSIVCLPNKTIIYIK